MPAVDNVLSCKGQVHHLFYNACLEAHCIVLVSQFDCEDVMLLLSSCIDNYWHVTAMLVTAA